MSVRKQGSFCCMLGCMRSSAKTREEFEHVYGDELWLRDPKKYDFVTKVEPLEKALDSLNVQSWITGRRRDHGGDRSELNIIEFDPSDGRIKLNPLASWTNKDVWRYIVHNNVQESTFTANVSK